MESVTGSVKHKRIYAREEFCVGCRLCEVHCITAHSQYKNDVVKAFKKSVRRPLPRIIVEEKRPISFGVQCRHCEEPECVKSCISGAMQKDPESGIVTNDDSRCVGCWTCILACPYGVVMRDNTGKKVASKCDFCIENGGEPACVKNCPNEAIYVGDVSEAGLKVETDGKAEINWTADTGEAGLKADMDGKMEVDWAADTNEAGLKVETDGRAEINWTADTGGKMEVSRKAEGSGEK